MSDDLVEVGRYLNLAEAEVVKTLLVGCGLRCEVFTDNQGNMVPYMAMFAPIRVLVPESRLAEAQAILAENCPPPPEAEAADEDLPTDDRGRAVVRRVFVASIFGLFIFPVAAQIYSLFMAEKAYRRWAQLVRGDRVKLVFATLFDLLVIGTAAAAYVELSATPAEAAALELVPGTYMADGDAGDVTVTKVDGGYKFAGVMTSPKANVCEFDGTVKQADDVLKIVVDAKTTCQVKVMTTPKGFRLEYVKDTGCDALCGDDTSMETDFLRSDPACTAAKNAQRRKDFKVQFDQKKFTEGKATLQALIDQCSAFLSLDETRWIANDLALTQLRLGDKAGCLKTLEPMQNLVDQLKSGYDGLGLDKTQQKAAEKLAKATKTNLNLCRK